MHARTVTYLLTCCTFICMMMKDDLGVGRGDIDGVKVTPERRSFN